MTRKGRFLPAILLPVLLLAPPAAAEGWRLGGYLKSLGLHSQAPPRLGLPSGEFSANRLRLDLTGEPAEGIGLEISGEGLLLYTDPPGFIPLPSDSPNRRLDLEKEWRRGERFATQGQVDRLNLSGRLAGVDWQVGRQAVGFGRILLVSPLDVIAPFPPDALDTDVRPGVDALRATRYFGLGGQVGGVAVLGDGTENDSYLLTLSHNAAGVDILGLGGQMREREMAGFGLAGDLGGLGLKGELAAYRGKEVGEPGGDLHDDFAVGALEGWYRFSNDLILVTEYLYNGAGVSDPEDYPWAASSAPFREGLSFLLGRHYLLLAPSREFHPLVTGSTLLIWNLDDGSFLLRPLVELSLSDELTLELFWSFTRGRKPEESPLPPFRIPRSEFGSAGESGGLFLRYYF